VASSTSTAPELRTDARRNREALIAAAKTVFGRQGVTASMEDVIREASVGRGTLYRHFPTREALFVAIMDEQVAALRARADELLREPANWGALEAWLRLYDASATAYPGMSAHVASGLADDSSPVAQACAPMKASFSKVWRRAQREGIVRDDLAPRQLLTLISSLPKDPAKSRTDPGSLQVVLDGLRRQH
jgi:AcrR family transcriptional regulator